MKIKIAEENREAIENALMEANGPRQGHYVAKTYEDVKRLADEAEGRLDALEVPKSYRKGVGFSALSEHPSSFANSYAKKDRTVKMTYIQMYRQSNGWVLYHVSRYDANVGRNQSDGSTLTLPRQAAEAAERVRHRRHRVTVAA